MGGLRRFTFLFLIAIVFVTIPTSSHAQSNDTEFIGDPGKWVSGPFLTYYHRTKNPEIIFGNPISIEFADPMTNTRVQYFEKARLEFNPENPGAVVNSVPLGELIFEAGEFKEAGIGNDPSVCHRFGNGKEVCYAFREFYQSQNGELFFGQPISNTLINKSGFLVQFFENALLEWHPEKKSGERVVVADLGSQYYSDIVDDPQFLRTAPDTLPADVNRIPAVNVYVSSAIIPANSTQRIFVVVYDQYHQPIPDSMVGVNISLPDGSESFYRLPETNSAGISILDLSIGALKPQEMIKIEASASFENVLKTGTAWFRIWW
ncbi:MAG: hypothetical protein HGB14_00660 [Anaerolineaceae bacterium]|nr:hypothetical protein [Anaerolineaceae bacterium]